MIYFLHKTILNYRQHNGYIIRYPTGFPDFQGESHKDTVSVP